MHRSILQLNSIYYSPFDWLIAISPGRYMNHIATRAMTTSAVKTISVVHDTVGRAFRAMSQDLELGHLEYRVLKRDSRTSVDFFHTFTERKAQGRGVAAKLVTAGLEWAKDQKYSVVPSCAYVAAFIEKNPQWKSSL